MSPTESHEVGCQCGPRRYLCFSVFLKYWDNRQDNQNKTQNRSRWWARGAQDAPAAVTAGPATNAPDAVAVTPAAAAMVTAGPATNTAPAAGGWAADFAPDPNFVEEDVPVPVQEL